MIEVEISLFVGTLGKQLIYKIYGLTEEESVSLSRESAQELRDKLDIALKKMEIKLENTE